MASTNPQHSRAVMSMGMPPRPPGRGNGCWHPTALAHTILGFRVRPDAQRFPITGGTHG
jgi:hypothetical protein